MPGIVNRLFENPEGYTSPSYTPASSRESGPSSAIVVLVLVAIVAGIIGGIVGANMGEDPNDPWVASERSSQQLDATIAARNRGEIAPVLTWDRPWPAENPVLFGSAIAGVVFVVGLLVIIASNSERR